MDLNSALVFTVSRVYLCYWLKVSCVSTLCSSALLKKRHQIDILSLLLVSHSFCVRLEGFLSVIQDVSSTLSFLLCTGGISVYFDGLVSPGMLK